MSFLLNASFMILESEAVPSHPGNTYVNFNSNVQAANTFCVGYSFLLRATRWWQDMRSGRITSWDEFKNELTLSVLPRSVRNRKANQFNEFQQEPGMSVTEYEDQFRKLC